MTVQREELGQKVIATYKLGKGIVQLGLAALVAFFVATNGTAHIASIAATLRHHVSEGWSVEIGRLLTLRHIELTGVALLLDGILSLVEGFALRRSRWWAPWLVVVATSLLVPIEIVAIVRHPGITRVVALLLNAGIVVFLARKAWHEHIARRGAATQ